MKNTLLTCLVLWIVSFLPAQTVVITVGTETTNGYYAPFNSYYHHSWNQ